MPARFCSPCNLFGIHYVLMRNADMQEKAKILGIAFLIADPKQDAVGTMVVAPVREISEE